MKTGEALRLRGRLEDGGILEVPDRPGTLLHYYRRRMMASQWEAARLRRRLKQLLAIAHEWRDRCRTSD